MTLRCLLLGHRWINHRVSLATLRASRTCARCGHVDLWEVPEKMRTAPMADELKAWLEKRPKELPGVEPAAEKGKR